MKLKFKKIKVGFYESHCGRFKIELMKLPGWAAATSWDLTEKSSSKTFSYPTLRIAKEDAQEWVDNETVADL